MDQCIKNCTSDSKLSISNEIVDFVQVTIEHVTPDFVHAHPYAAIAVILLLYFCWNLFLRPFDLYKDFSEYGFDECKNGREGNDVNRRRMINEVRQRRKVGDLPPSFPNGWFAILESDRLKKEKVEEVYALEQNLVAWRGESGKSYVADAYCPHLGAHLGVGGKVTGECIECPFHSWTFDGDKKGKLTCIPYASSVPDFVKLKMWTTFETNGYIFLWYHAENEEPSWFPDKVPEVDSGKWAYRGRSEFQVACHIQEIPENGADVAHLNVLHSSAFLCGDNPERSLFSWGFLKHGWAAKWMPNPDPKRSYEALLKVNHHINLFGSISLLPIPVDVHQTGPGIVLLYFETRFGNGVLIQTVTPIEPLLQKVTHRFYSSSTLIQPIAKMILSGEAVQIARDIRIWNRKCFVNRPVLTKEDQPIKTYRRWFSQFYSENSPRHYFGNANDVNANKF